MDLILVMLRNTNHSHHESTSRDEISELGMCCDVSSDTGRAGRFCTDGICLVPPQPEGAALGYGEWCTPPADHLPGSPPGNFIRDFFYD